MTSERVQRQIDRLLNEAEAAITGPRWDVARDRARAALALDATNADALALLATSETRTRLRGRQRAHLADP